MSVPTAYGMWREKKTLLAGVAALMMTEWLRSWMLERQQRVRHTYAVSQWSVVVLDARDRKQTHPFLLVCFLRSCRMRAFIQSESMILDNSHVTNEAPTRPSALSRSKEGHIQQHRRSRNI